MDLIASFQFLKYSNDRIELEIAKEYLLKIMDDHRKTIKDQSDKARNGNVDNYVINIFTNKLEERVEFLNRLLNDVVYEINQEKKRVVT